jgi:NitT/TauT family transport system ATP-binding protein
MTSGPAAQMRPELEVRNVALKYMTPEREMLALSDINLDVAPGEFVALVGPSGCGKSTLLTLLSGLVPPSKGSIAIRGSEVTAPSNRVGFMFQKDTLFEWRTVLQNVLIGAELLHLDKSAAQARAEELLRGYGLEDFLHSLPHQLSGGMRQRVALARTLLSKPDILLLDEPFSALDYQTRLALSDEMAAILRHEGKTVILVTHDIGEAVSMADRVVVMSRRPGRIKSRFDIRFASATRPLPLAARALPEFNDYFRKIWDELDMQSPAQALQ